MKKFVDNNKVLELRNEGKNCREIATILGCGNNHINKILREKFKLKVLNPYSHIRKYPINEEFFNDLNKEETAYFLGLLYADGCVVKNFNLVNIFLMEQDRYILEYITKLLQPTKPLTFKPKSKKGTTDYYGISINSKKIKEQLIEIGCIPNKTYHLEWPKFNFDEKNIVHFIRGYLDGDGCIYAPQKDINKSCVCIVGHELFINKLKEIIHNKLYINCSLVKPKNTNAPIQQLYIYGSKQSEAFCDYIYKDATIFLKRKYDKYLLIKNRPNKRIK